MPVFLAVIFTLFPILIASVIAGITGLTDAQYSEKMKERAKSALHETGSFPSSVSFMGKTLTVNANEVNVSKEEQADQKVFEHRKAVIEQTLVNACISLYMKCGNDSRTSPNYSNILLTTNSSNYSVSVSPQKNGYLSLKTVHASGGASTYYGIWNGSYAITTGDKLIYEVFVPSGLPQSSYVGGMDMKLSDATWASGYGLIADDGAWIHVSDLSPYVGKWHKREINLNAIAGKTAEYATLVVEADTAGTYEGIKYRNIVIMNGTTVKARIWSPSYLWAFLDAGAAAGLISDVLNGTSSSTITCAAATEADFSAYGKYLIKNALNASYANPVTVEGTTRNFYFTRPTGGSGCGYADIVELR